MNQIDRLAQQMLDKYNTKLEELIAETRGVTVNEARCEIRNATFGEWLEMNEATVDRNPSLTSGTTGTTAGASQPAPATPNQPKTPVDASGSNDASSSYDNTDLNQDDIVAIDGNEQELAQVVNVDYAGNATVVDKHGKQTTVNKSKLSRVKNKDGNWLSALTDMPANAIKNFNTGKSFAKSFAVESEIDDLKRRAGIAETSTTGATSACNIASTPSIIGNTNDGHKPTVQLRKKERLKREKKERRKKYQSEVAKRKATE